MACYSSAVALVPRYEDAYANAGVAPRALGAVDDAMGYRRALLLNPRNAGAHYNLGMALLLTGRFTKGGGNTNGAG